MLSQRSLRFASLLVFVAIAGCSAGRTTHSPPAYLLEAEHSRTFDSADELAEYLRFDAQCSPLISAHRGGPVRGFPENAIETLRRSLRSGPVFLEVDVRETSDGVPMLLHDETLDRTTTGTGRIDETSFHDVRRLFLRDNLGVITPFQVPTLAEALAWGHGRAIFTLDVKRGVDPEVVIDMVRSSDTEGHVIIIVYGLEQYVAYQSLAPDLVYSVSLRDANELQEFLDANGNFDRSIVWTGVGIPDSSLVDLIHSHNALAMAGTFGDIDDEAARSGPDVYHELLNIGIDVIATDNVRLASIAADNRIPVRVGC